MICKCCGFTFLCIRLHKRKRRESYQIKKLKREQKRLQEELKKLENKQVKFAI
tara:strand:- start:758 stop:916 length:159 start_codon:yes stop_codon:yes gene_type:complete